MKHARSRTDRVIAEQVLSADPRGAPRQVTREYRVVSKRLEDTAANARRLRRDLDAKCAPTPPTLQL